MKRIAGAVAALLILGVAGCDLPHATAGAKCAKPGAYASDGTYILSCNKKRRWERGITVAAGQAALDRWVAELRARQAPPPLPPQPVTTSPVTTPTTQP